jgi:peptidoglycan/xylan/chitin deacetylase (PgdA/CDA1 family)
MHSRCATVNKSFYHNNKTKCRLKKPISYERVVSMEIYDLLKKNQEIWDLFTRKEEYNSSIRDQCGRFSYSASSNRNILKPSVSKYLIEQGYHVEYPEDKPFAVCLTHDIDNVYTSHLEKIVSAKRHLQQGSLSGFKQSVAQMRSKKLPLWNFNDIIALEEKYDAKSSFYFMAENSGEVDYAYQIEDFESVLRDIVDSGSEVGLHGGHTSYLSLEELVTKKERLEKVLHKKVVGYRNHYLKFKVPETWEYLHEAGFLYDTTFGYADHIGFRNGMCHPYKPFNLKKGKSIEILEIPLIIMDRTLQRNMNLDTGRAWDLSKKIIESVEKYNGVLTLLWHNNDFSGDQRKLYEKILKYCVEKNAWMTNGEHISAWWKDNVRA